MSVGGPALLQRDLQRVSGIPRLRRGIVAQLDEAIDLLPLDASRLLEPDPEHPFGRLVVEDHRARRVHEDHWDGQVAGQLPREDEEDYHTAAGMLINQFGRIPQVGEHFEWLNYRFEVVDLDGARVDKLLIARVARDGNGSAAT